MLRVEIWIFTTLFALGVIGGMTYLNLTGIPARPAPANNSNDSRASGVLNEIPFDGDLSFENADPDYTNALLQKGDRYLIAGNYALALDRYYEFEKAVASSGTATLLRQALCCELQQEYSRAEKKYHHAITAAPNVQHRLLAIAGSARCLARMGKRRESLAILADQSLKIDLHPSVPDEILAQFVYQFANVLLMNTSVTEMDLLTPSAAAFADSVPLPEIQLKVIDDTSHLVADAIERPAEFKIEILQKPSTSANVITASVSARVKSVLLVVSQLAAASELELFVSQRASAAIQNRSKSIELRSTQLSTLLDRLLAQFGLVWYQIDTELHVVTREELNPAIAPRQFWFDSAQRAFRSFELRFPDDSRRRLALLARANLSLIQNRLDAAANQYQELAQSQPGDEILAMQFFNQAKLQMLLGRTDEANPLLYLAIDQTLDPLIESSSYCLLSANLLSTGDLETTIRTSRRGLATAVNNSQKQSAALTLARAYLLHDDPFSANNVLFESRDAFEDESAKQLAAILGTYARYMGVKNKAGIRKARNRLFAAIAMISDSDYASFADCYLAAHAFQELGFIENSIDKYLLALSRPDVGTWQRRILYELALAQKSAGQIDGATSALQGLVGLEDDKWRRLALQQLAEILIETNQPEACIETCKTLWQSELNDQEKQAVLEVLGIAYQQQGENHAAALCFAGILPETF